MFGSASVGPDPAAVIVRLLRYPYAVLRDLWRGQINLRAMGLVFTTLFALSPLLGFALLVWTLLGTIRKVEESSNFLWHVQQPRSFGRR